MEVEQNMGTQTLPTSLLDLNSSLFLKTGSLKDSILPGSCSLQDFTPMFSSAFVRYLFIGMKTAKTTEDDWEYFNPRISSLTFWFHFIVCGMTQASI